MNCKKLLVTSMILTSCILCAPQSFSAAPMKVQISKNYVDISRMIEYTNYAEADAKLKEILQKNPNDLEAKAAEGRRFADGPADRGRSSG